MTRVVEQRMKYAIKVAIAHTLYAAGLLQLWQRILTRRRAVVLMYHRVLTEDEWRATGSHPAMSVTMGTFERQMELVRQRFVPLTLDEFAGRLRQRQPFADASCLITFDDGWRDTMTNALPVLRQRQLPVVIFLPVNFIGSRRLFAREAFAHLLMLAIDQVRREPASGPRFRALLLEVGLERLLDLTGPDARATVIASVGAAPIDASIEKLVSQLSDELGVRVEQLETPDTFMNWTEVENLSQQGVTFGGHGADHRQLALLPPAMAAAEVRVAKEVSPLASRRPYGRSAIRTARAMPRSPAPCGSSATRSRSPLKAAWSAAMTTRCSSSG